MQYNIATSIESAVSFALVVHVIRFLAACWICMYATFLFVFFLFLSVINKNKWVHETIVSISWANEKNEEEKITMERAREKERQHHQNQNEWMQTRWEYMCP